jgi:multidrug efflux pump subunit AcrA (membrane-fusion protein)
MKSLGLILGIVIAGAGGLFLYRALFVEPATGYVVTETHVRQLPNTVQVVGGIALLVLGALIAFFSLRSKTRT